MTELSAFAFPPYQGNAIALVAYYAVFVLAQIGLALWRHQRWNWSIFVPILICLILQILGSVAYLKLHFQPVTGSWYNLWIVTLTIGPTFFISTMHRCMDLALQKADLGTSLIVIDNVRFSRSYYLSICYLIDALTIMISVVGGIYVSIRSSVSQRAAQPGFDIMVAAMALQTLSISITLVISCHATFASFRSSQRSASCSAKNVPETKDFGSEKHTSDETIDTFKKPRLFQTFLINALFINLLLLSWAIVRAVDLAGGISGPLQLPLLVNVEQIIIFVAILCFTILHPAVVLPRVGTDTMGQLR